MSPVYRFLESILLTAICSFGFIQIVRSQKPANDKPNIIFILVDDQGYGDLGVFYQNERAALKDPSKPFQVTPHLDLMAQEGAMLTQHYCAAPVCAPSRASLLLGVSQGNANVRNDQFDKAIEDNYTMASTLRQTGYSTAIIGKWGLQGNDKYDKDGYKWPAHPLKRGFDYFFGYMRHSDGHEHYPNDAPYRLYWAEKEKEVWQNYENMTDKLEKCYTADLWVAAAKHYIVDQVKGTKEKRPFFLYLAFETPHAVLELPTERYPPGKGLSGGLKWIGKPGHFINTAEGKIDSYVYPEYANAVYDDDHDTSTPLVPWPETYKRYATANRRIDDGVGDIMQLLKDLKIDSNTIIVYTSDNGPSMESYLPEKFVANHPTFFGSYGPFDGVKRDNWEGGVRMPTIAWWPGHIASGKKIESPSISYDWAPTFLDIAGFSPPVRMDGVSLLPSLTGRGSQENGLIYIEYFAESRTPDFKAFEPNHRNRVRNQMQLIRLGDFVGVRYDIKSANDNFEIYDVRSDPKESLDLALHPDKVPRGKFPVMTQRGLKELNLAGFQNYMKERVLQVRHTNQSAPRPYDTTRISPAATGNVFPGISWKIYAGDFPWIPNVNHLDQDDQGISLVPDAGLTKNYGSAVICFNGYIRVPADGKYTFFMTADSKAYLRIHDFEAIDEDYGYSGNLSRECTLFLKEGLHPFKLYYYKVAGNRNPFLKLAWSSDSMKRKSVNSYFVHQ